MSTPTIEINFKLDGNDILKVNGVQGPTCKAFSKPFEIAIGGHVVNVTATPEASQMPATISAAAAIVTR